MSSEEDSAAWNSEVSSSESSDLSEDDGDLSEAHDVLQQLDRSAESLQTPYPEDGSGARGGGLQEKRVSEETPRQHEPVASASASSAVPAVSDSSSPLPLAEDFAAIAPGNLSYTEAKELEANSEDLD